MDPRAGYRALVLATVATLALVGCGGDAGAPAPRDGVDDDAPAHRPAGGPPATDAATPGGALPATRSLRLEQAGWRFDIDARDGASGTLLEVLVRTATVGAAPRRLRVPLEGELADAFATDLDGDAVPELLLWRSDGGSAATGDVVGWRFAADGESSDLRLPALDGDLATGWRGRDQFGVQGDRLVRTFPLYRDEDDNATPGAGFVRVVRYAIDGRGLYVDETTLEPMDGTPQAEVLAR